ncbi:MAG: uronate isomerase [Saprospiraceae bacterium]|nr:MAG: uronate isomerase [Saprospiraceae bacterium]
MKTFLSEDFLLSNKTAQKLYFDHAADMPIIDYHNHLPPQEIAADKVFENITEVWLKGDHYKWRAMRANGVDERYITGDATDKSKFLKWAETVPYTMRNPLYHWTHLELQRYFGIDTLLNAKTGEEIYEATTVQLQTSAFSTRNLLKKMKVEAVCTTDDPTDSLEFHQQLKQQNPGLKTVPGFRPDKFIMIENPVFPEMIETLGKVTGKNIQDLKDLLEALHDRIDFFHSMGGRLADHGLTQLYASDFTEDEVNKIFRKRLAGHPIFAGEAIQYQSAILYFLGLMYHAKGWTMQFHLGAIRNNNDRLMNILGSDVGCDSVGDYEQATALSRYLNRLDAEEKLTKTILYNLNPRDNELFATMAGNFNDGIIPGKIQWGSAWWFLDQKDGMEAQLNVLSNMGLLSRFLGMLTDSRSFLSFPRHEYFRRILCNLIGKDVENGELPNDLPWLGQMVEDICYHNAKRYLEF